MNRPIRIAQIMGKFNLGGVDNFLMNYYRFLDLEKYQFDFIVDGHNTIPCEDEIKQRGGEIYYLHSYEKNFIKTLYELYKILKTQNYIIVHAHLNTLNPIYLFVAYICKIPIRISHNHSTTHKQEFLKNIIKNIFRPFSKSFATNYCACSLHAGRWMFGEKICESSLFNVIPNYIDYSRFYFDNDARIKIRKDLGFSNNIVIGNFARLEMVKNHFFIIKLAKKIVDINPMVRFLLIGDGSLKEMIFSLIKQENLQKHFIILPPRVDIEKFYSAIDIFLMPSLYEGLGIVAIEAQVSGIYCITSDNVPKEVIISNKIYQLSLTDPDVWIDKINYLIQNSFYLTRNIPNSQSYDINENRDFLANYYDRLLSLSNQM